VTSQTSSITLNGEPRTVAAGSTVGALLDALDLAGKRVAVERNGSIVPRARHATRSLPTATASKSWLR
jgi:sulfur carrier protein